MDYLMILPYVYDHTAVLRHALPANGDLDRDGLPLISRLTVLSAIHCSAGFTLDTSEVYISDINQRLRNARHVRLPKPWWWWWWREEGGLWRRVELLECGNLLSGGADGVGGWLGRVRRAHSRPYPLSCFMTTLLNGAWTSITASCHSEPSDSGRCQPKKSSQESALAVLSQESLLLLIRDHLSSAAQDTVPQSDELSEFNILDPKHSWVVVFPWFLWGENRGGVNFICMSFSS